MRLKIETYLKEANCPDIVLANVDVDFCRGFIDFLRYAKNTVRRDGSVISNGAAHHHQAVLNGALNKAVRDGILSANPLKSISSKEKYQPTESMREYLTLEEMKAAMAAPCPHEDVKRAFLFCCFTGLRYSDVSVLTWRNIKQVNGGLVVSIQSMRKTEKQVIIPLNLSALKWLPDRNGCKPGQKVFDMTRLSTCDRCLKKDGCCRRNRKEGQFSHGETFDGYAVIGCRGRLIHGREAARTYKYQLDTGLCRCGDGN